MKPILILFAAVAIGCGGRVSLGDNAEGSNGLTGSGEDAAAEASVTDVGAHESSVSDTTTPNGPFPIMRVDEHSPAPRVIVVLADCTVIDNGVDLGKGDPTRCSELWTAALDPTTSTTTDPCPTGGGTYTLTLHTSAETSYVKTQDDYCHPGLPGIGAHKHVYAVFPR